MEHRRERGHKAEKYIDKHTTDKHADKQDMTYIKVKNRRLTAIADNRCSLLRLYYFN